MADNESNHGHESLGRMLGKAYKTGVTRLKGWGRGTFFVPSWPSRKKAEKGCLFGAGPSWGRGPHRKRTFLCALLASTIPKKVCFRCRAFLAKRLAPKTYLFWCPPDHKAQKSTFSVQGLLGKEARAESVPFFWCPPGHKNPQMVRFWCGAFLGKKLTPKPYLFFCGFLASKNPRRYVFGAGPSWEEACTEHVRFSCLAGLKVRVKAEGLLLFISILSFKLLGTAARIEANQMETAKKTNRSIRLLMFYRKRKPLRANRINPAACCNLQRTTYNLQCNYKYSV